eukprot:scaffold219383_cov27-Tisochrysis_lutea.AAC.2
MPVPSKARCLVPRRAYAPTAAARLASDTSTSSHKSGSAEPMRSTVCGQPSVEWPGRSDTGKTKYEPGARRTSHAQCATGRSLMAVFATLSARAACVAVFEDALAAHCTDTRSCAARVALARLRQLEHEQE